MQKYAKVLKNAKKYAEICFDTWTWTVDPVLEDLLRFEIYSKDPSITNIFEQYCISLRSLFSS